MVLDPGLNGCEALQYVITVEVLVTNAALHYGWLCGAPGAQADRVSPQCVWL